MPFLPPKEAFLEPVRLGFFVIVYLYTAESFIEQRSLDEIRKEVDFIRGCACSPTQAVYVLMMHF